FSTFLLSVVIPVAFKNNSYKSDIGFIIFY
ncbi:MAG: hypothetical protein ACI8X3_000383, partial [Saprospiraceae bacterium]